MIGRINIDDFFKKQPNTETKFCDLCLVINKLADNLNHIEQEMWTDEKKFFELSDLVVANGNQIAKLQESVQGVVDNSIKDGAYIQALQDQVKEIKQYLDWDEISRKPSEEDLRDMLKDPKYWKEQDPETIRKVELAFQKKYGEITQNSTNNSEKLHLFQENEQKDHKIRSTNERLREALSLAENALIRLANDACDMDKHIYIDAILSRIDAITKGDNNE